MFGFPSLAETVRNQSQAPLYPTNKYGQTYGSSSLATSPDTEPDLIRARGEDGTIGYVRSEDLHGEMPKTPEEALELMRKTPSVRIIPLYAVDGRTVIGTFHITNAR